jgi:hypothetical protein
LRIDDLEYFYENEYIDFTTESGFEELFFIDLKYVKNGQDIVLKALKPDYIVDIKELQYIKKALPLHYNKIDEWLDWVYNYLKDITNIDSDYDKDYAKERWDDDGSLQEEYPDFEDYWKYYRNSDSYWEMIGDMEREAYDEFRYEHKEAFDIMDKSTKGGYYDNYNNALSLNRYLEDAYENLLETIKDFEASKIDYTTWSLPDLQEVITNLFERN